LQLGSYSTSIGTHVSPDGSVDYSASSSTFLYMGPLGGAQPEQIGHSMSRYVVRGTVRDETGAPVEGAAVQLNEDVVYTNSAGNFLLRAKHPEVYRLSVLTGEFLLPGQWLVVKAPAQITAMEETSSALVEIVLRRGTTDASGPEQPAPENPPPETPAP
ncbi:MAG TPA: carboxypeptidase regulatory-like domain-containing protein, partial [Gemmatimonadales bacterium]|nr:carboxypeptidase regulatory-like domain-containing protein [Gemmatimonadales bacterium]